MLLERKVEVVVDVGVVVVVVVVLVDDEDVAETVPDVVLAEADVEAVTVDLVVTVVVGEEDYCPSE